MSSNASRTGLKMSRTTEGKPVQILEGTEEQGFLWHLDALEEVLLAKNVKDKPVAVVSVAGAYRTGKSYLLNCFLRFMRQQLDGKPGLGDPNEPLDGFQWGGGSDLVTEGIYVWNQVFHVTTSKGEELAVLFMDTQGTFDCTSTVEESATIFAMSTLISSVQIYNLFRNIQEDDLQNLQLFADYGRIASKHTTAKPFQKLLFLVRDWCFVKDASYGEDGGFTILERRLKTSVQQKPELRQVRKDIRSWFSELACFLMPPLGDVAATSETFDGRQSYLSEKFRDQLEKLAHGILAPDRLLVKNVNGNVVTCAGLLTLFKGYADVFNGSDLPHPMSILEVTARYTNLQAKEKAVLSYVSAMEKVCGEGQPYVEPKDLETHNDRAKNSAIKVFQNAPKVGGDAFFGSSLHDVSKEIDEVFKKLEARNKERKKPPITALDAIIIAAGVASLGASCISMGAGAIPATGAALRAVQVARATAQIVQGTSGVVSVVCTAIKNKKAEEENPTGKN